MGSTRLNFMNKKCIFQFFLLLSLKLSLASQDLYKWAVIGAGPAGIISVAQLMEHGVEDKDIVWIDQEFATGRLGKYYGNVPSNNKAHRFIYFLQQTALFAQFDSPAVQVIKDYDQEKEFPLQLAVNVFNDITYYLRTRIHSEQALVDSLETANNLWRLNLTDKTLYAEKVILATGSHPKRFNYTTITEIPLDIALDEEKLKNYINHDDTIMVVGSAHSALLILKFLHDFDVKQIINLYTKQPSFDTLDAIQGVAATWTQTVLLPKQPNNILRLLFDTQTLESYLPTCTKIIYAFGYEPNEILVNGTTQISYDATTGNIQKNLYGIGIAFPAVCMENGRPVSLIGVNSFVERAKEVIPLWIQ